jgi:transglutaminase-like putative cysteine protease
MSWLRIRHSTVYDYSAPVELGPHRLVLRPREGHDVRVDSFALHVEPRARLSWIRDIFGNSVALLSDFAAPAPRLAITSEAILWLGAAKPAPDPRTPDPGVWPVVYDPLETAVAEAYRLPMFPDDRAAIQAWLSTGEPGEPSGPPTTIDLLARRIHREIAYARREEKGVLTPAQTLALRRGSCRDMATLLLEAGRSLGFAMRFASGYLECDASREGKATTHAWVEACLPGLGWRGYDATSGLPATDHHIVAGVSNHPRGVMPVSGRYQAEEGTTALLVANVFTERLAASRPACAADAAAA